MKLLQNPHVFLTFGKVRNPLRLPRKTTSERPKVLRTPQFFALLTWKCASCHNSVHFFDRSTSKSGPSMVCFPHFDLDTHFAPQRPALFRHHHFQKWSDIGVRRRCNLHNLTWECASRHSGVHFFNISTSKSASNLKCF